MSSLPYFKDIVNDDNNDVSTIAPHNSKARLDTFVMGCS
jgi:hypothetical protein